MLQKALFKIVACAIYIYTSYTLFIHLHFVYIQSPFPQQIVPQNTVQLYMLRDCSSVRIGFNMINKRRTLPVVYTMLV